MTDITDSWRGEEGVKRLTKMHVKRTSDDQTIKKIVSKGINKKLESYTRIISGEVNEVYEATLEGDNTVIVRIGHIQDKSFESETWAIEQARNVGVPVAKILAIGELDLGDMTLNYSIQDKLTGKRFDDLLWGEQIASERAKCITENAGEVLARLHSVKATSGAGYISAGGQGQFADLAAWSAAHLIKRELYEALFKQYKFTPDDLASMFTILDSAKDIFEQPPHLLHGDFGPKHIFVDDSDNITGIIDLEQASSGDTVFDLVNWDFWFKNNVPIAWLQEGYARVGSLGDNFENRFKIAQLDAMLHLLNYYTNVSIVPDCASDAAATIRELVA